MRLREIALLMFGLSSPASAAAQRPDFWVTTLGNDTVALERVTTSGRRVEGRLVTLTPRVRILDYAVELAPDGSVQSIQSGSKAGLEGPGVAPPQSITANFVGGTINAIINRGTRVDTLGVAGAGRAVPNALYAWGLFGLVVRTAMAQKVDSATVEQWGLGARAITKVPVVRRGDSLAVDFFGSPMMAKVDKDGRVRGVDGNRTTIKVLAHRRETLDLDGLTAGFVAREQAGQVAGALSTRDTVQAGVLGASLWIDYGRPSKRGRQLFGGVIPYDQVWRTGANAATQFRTDRALTIGTLAVPAGTYTLWTLPTTRGITLIVNKQTGQWGTAYDPSQDLGRVAMDVEKLDALVERFTVSAVEQAGHGELRFDWDHTRWVARFKAP